MHLSNQAPLVIFRRVPAGWLAGRIVKGHRLGLVGDAAVGIVGVLIRDIRLASVLPKDRWRYPSHGGSDCHSEAGSGSCRPRIVAARRRSELNRGRPGGRASFDPDYLFKRPGLI